MRSAMKDLLPWFLMAALSVAWMLDRNTRAPVEAPPVSAVALTAEPAGDPGQVFQLADLAAQREASGRPYLSFLTVPTLRAGLYALPASGTDGQQPHGKDEVYYVVAGRSGMTIGDQEYTIAPGAVIFVPAQAEHRFHDIEEDVQLLVFFSEADPAPSEE